VCNSPTVVLRWCDCSTWRGLKHNSFLQTHQQNFLAIHENSTVLDAGKTLHNESFPLSCSPYTYNSTALSGQSLLVFCSEIFAAYGKLILPYLLQYKNNLNWEVHCHDA
jgi:hypothetical protein